MIAAAIALVAVIVSTQLLPQPDCPARPTSFIDLFAPGLSKRCEQQK